MAGSARRTSCSKIKSWRDPQAGGCWARTKCSWSLAPSAGRSSLVLTCRLAVWAAWPIPELCWVPWDTTMTCWSGPTSKEGAGTAWPGRVLNAPRARSDRNVTEACVGRTGNAKASSCCLSCPAPPWRGAWGAMPERSGRSLSVSEDDR